MLQRFDGSMWHDVERFRSMEDANTALDRAIGDGQEPGALRIVEAAPSATARALMIAGVVVCAAVAAGIVWLFVAGT